MPKDELVKKLAARAGVGRAQAKAVLDALAELGDGHGHPRPIEDVDPGPTAGGRSPAPQGPLHYQPTSAEVASLIEDARRHPLGLEFLAEGELGSVAVTFGVHAFTVDAARSRLGAEQD